MVYLMPGRFKRSNTKYIEMNLTNNFILRHYINFTFCIRYFLGNFLQSQLFQGMCEASLNLPVGSTAFNLPLHKCDIYGSKDAGKFLRLVKVSTSARIL